MPLWKTPAPTRALSQLPRARRVVHPPVAVPISRAVSVRRAYNTSRPVPFPSKWQGTATAQPGDQRSSGADAMDSNVEQLLAPARLGEVRNLWFEHLSGPDSLVLPTPDEMKRWFKDSELDRACIERFGPTLEAIRQSSLRSDFDVLAAAKPEAADEWLGLVILLDQIPRNCYRGEAAAVVFEVFDPMARAVSLAAIERGIPYEQPQIRWQFAYRQWFGLPLMHSEDLAIHETATRWYEQLRRDLYALADGNGAPDAADHYRAKAAAVIKREPDETRKMGDMYLEFEQHHKTIIQRFGRYPHRNKALMRESTAEEREYLDSGGETFGG